MYLCKLIDSFVKNRSLQTQHNQKKSTKKILTVGLPQGSILSPTFFNIFTNDMPRHHQTELALYADDTAIIAESTNLRMATLHTERHLNDIFRYLRKWKLKTDTEKTTINLTQKHRIGNYRITIDNTAMENSTEVKYLGVTLDHRLITFRKHIDQIKGKAYAAKQIISPYITKTNPLSRKTKLQLYRAYIQPIMLYAVPAWSAAANTHLKKLQIMERHCFRQILGKNKQEIRNEELYNEIGETLLLEKMKATTRKFFETKVQTHPLTSHIGLIRENDAPFRVKHKLITDLLNR